MLTGNVRRFIIMAKIMKNLKIYLFWPLLVGGLLSALGGCRSGINYDNIPLNAQHLIDFGHKLKKGEIGAGSIAYGLTQLGEPGVGTGAGNILVPDLESIAQGLKALGEISYTDIEEYNRFKTYIDDLSSMIRTKADAAISSPAGAVELYTELATAHLLPTLGESLNNRIVALAKEVPLESKVLYDQNAKKITDSVEQIYQFSVVLSQSLAQREAVKKISLIKKALATLSNKINSQAGLIIGTQADLDAARSELSKAIYRFENAEKEVGKMTSLSKVRTHLLDYTNNLAALKTSYIDKTDTEDSARTLYDEAEEAREEFSNKIIAYREDIKDLPFAGLEESTRRAFGKVALVSSSISVNEETDLMKLIRLLSTKQVVLALLDDDFINALAVAVSSRGTESFGLPAANLWAFDSVSLNAAKSDFGMSDTDFREYSGSQSSKGYQMTSDNNKYSNLYLIYADRIASGFDVNDIIKKLPSKSKAIVVTAHPSSYPGYSSFVPSGLDVAAAFHVVRAVISEVNPNLDSAFMAEFMAKVMPAFRRSPTQTSLHNIIIATKNSVAYLAGRPTPSKDDAEQAIIDSLSALPLNPYGELFLIKNTTIKVSEMSTVALNLKLNPNYYYDEARGLSADDLDLRNRELAEKRKYEKAKAAEKEEQAFLKKTDAELAKTTAVLDGLKKTVKERETEAGLAVKRIKSNIDSKISAIEHALGQIRLNAFKCHANKTALPTLFVGTFSDAMRQALLHEIVNPIPGPGPMLDAIQGKPDMTLPQADLSWASCVFFGDTDNIKTVIKNTASEINLNLSRLKLDIESCSPKNTISSIGEMEQCLKDAVKKTDDYRKSLAIAAPGSKSLLERINDQVKLFDEHNIVVNNMQNFWRESVFPYNVIPLALLNPADSFGGKISQAQTPDQDTRIGHRILNQHYYIREALKIIGTNNGMAKLSSQITNPSNLAVANFYNIAGAAPLADKNQHSLLKELIANFDENASLMVEARRAVNDEYDHFVAAAMARIIRDKMAEKVYSKIVKPFWELPYVTLKRFAEEGTTAGFAERRRIWTKITELTPLIKALSTALKKDFVQQSDGKGILYATNNLLALNNAYNDLVLKLNELITAIAVPAVYIGLDANDTAALNLISTRATTLRDDLYTGNPAIAGLVVGAGTAAEWNHAYWAAYDLHNFTYFRFNGVVPLVPLNLAGVTYGANPLHPLPAGLNNADLIRHPLEP